jgi:hypothetical protein
MPIFLHYFITLASLDSARAHFSLVNEQHTWHAWKLKLALSLMKIDDLLIFLLSLFLSLQAKSGAD